MISFGMILVTSHYGAHSKLPYVEIEAKNKLKEPFQLSPEEARDFALNLIEAAEAAEQDAFIFEFHRDFVRDASEDERNNIGANMLINFRKWRDDHGQNK